MASRAVPTRQRAENLLPGAREYSLIDSMSMAPDGSLRAQVDEDRVLFYRPAAGTGDAYRLEGVLGQGGLGVVFRGVDTSNGKAVAVKRPLFAPGTRRNQVEDLLREGLAAAQVSHPNVLRTLDANIDSEGPFLVTELIDGPDLSRVVKEHGALDEQRAARILMALCHAMGNAHASGLIHRDLKPSNVVLDARDKPYILDFGLARSMLDVRVDEAGRFLGTPGYVAPEQARNAARADHRADIYSLGVTMYVMLTAKPPQPLEIDALPEHWQLPLGRATHPDPAVRQLNCFELARDLLAACAPKAGICICCNGSLAVSNLCPHCGLDVSLPCPACGAPNRPDAVHCAACRREVRQSAAQACKQSFAMALRNANHLVNAQSCFDWAMADAGPDPGPKLMGLAQLRQEQTTLHQRTYAARLAFSRAQSIQAERGEFAALVAFHDAAKLDKSYEPAYLNCLAWVNPAALPDEGEAPLSEGDLQRAVYSGDDVTANRYYREREKSVQLAMAAGNTSAHRILPEIDRQRKRIARRWKIRTLLIMGALIGLYVLNVVFGIWQKLFELRDRRNHTPTVKHFRD
ncbi:MAG: protein kinase [Planctomycetes bacterium]|nr:protein kinase [Planctomycetota bacterium]